MLERTPYMRDSTKVSVDPFSDILKFTRAESLVTGGFTAGGSWAMRFPAPDKIKFFAVVKGSCWVRLEGEPEPGQVGPGDVGLLTAKRSFILSSQPDLEPVDAMDVFRGSVSGMAHLGVAKTSAILAAMYCWIPQVANYWRTPCRHGFTFLPPRPRQQRFSGCSTNSSENDLQTCPERVWLPTNWPSSCSSRFCGRMWTRPATCLSDGCAPLPMRELRRHCGRCTANLGTRGDLKSLRKKPRCLERRSPFVSRKPLAYHLSTTSRRGGCGWRNEPSETTTSPFPSLLAPWAIPQRAHLAQPSREELAQRRIVTGRPSAVLSGSPTTLEERCSRK